MKKTECFTLESARDGLPLSLMLLEPEGEVRVLVQLSHGMVEHKERYLPFMRYLAERGCACVINDHRGHGASVRSADDLGYFYQDGDGALVDDLHQIALWMRARWPGVPLILFGHSMGSLAVRAYAGQYAHDIDALIVCGSPGENRAAGLGLKMIAVLSRLLGERYRSKLFYAMTIGEFQKRFPDPKHPCAWISRNMDNVRAYEADPLCSFRFTLNGNRALLRLMQRAYHLPQAQRTLPVRFYSGADDPCAPDAKGFEHAMDAMRRAGFTDVQGRMFPGLRHEILNEDECGMVFETIWREAIAPLAEGRR